MSPQMSHLLTQRPIRSQSLSRVTRGDLFATSFWRTRAAANSGLLKKPNVRMLSRPRRVSYEVCNMQAVGMKDNEGSARIPLTFMHNLPPQVLLPIHRTLRKDHEETRSLSQE